MVVDLGTALPGVDSTLKIVISTWGLSVLASCPTFTTYFLCMTLGRKLNNLCLGFFICKMGTLLMPNPLSCWEKQMRRKVKTLWATKCSMSMDDGELHQAPKFNFPVVGFWMNPLISRGFGFFICTINLSQGVVRRIKSDTVQCKAHNIFVKC